MRINLGKNSLKSDSYKSEIIIIKLVINKYSYEHKNKISTQV